MEKGFGAGQIELKHYAESVFRPVDSALERIGQSIASSGLPQIQVGPMDGRHLEVLSRALAPSTIVEIGTLGGYSGLCLMRGIRPGGEFHGYEKSAAHAELTRRNLQIAKEQEGLQVSIHIQEGEALKALAQWPRDRRVDLVFIDADKVSYSAYLDWAAQHLRVGGVVLGDNTFGWGDVVRVPELIGQARDTVGALDQFNRKLAADSRFLSTIWPTAEGLTMGVKVRD
jgi:caffeoyl-CoA O-methyltransferase